MTCYIVIVWHCADVCISFLYCTLYLSSVTDLLTVLMSAHASTHRCVEDQNERRHTSQITDKRRPTYTVIHYRPISESLYSCEHDSIQNHLEQVLLWTTAVRSTQHGGRVVELNCILCIAQVRYCFSAHCNIHQWTVSNFSRQKIKPENGIVVLVKHSVIGPMRNTILNTASPIRSAEDVAMKLRLINKRSVSVSVAATIWIPLDIKTNVLLKVQVPVAMYCIMDVYE